MSGLPKTVSAIHQGELSGLGIKSYNFDGERMQSKISKRKRHMGGIPWGRSSTGFQESSPNIVPQAMLNCSPNEL